jgi:hypothetical protein
VIGLVFWILILGILWRVPEWRFLIFFILANNVLYTLMFIPELSTMTPEQWREYLLAVGQGDLIFAAFGVPLIAFRKWQKTQRPGGDKNLDKEMERIRAEIAARDQSSS